MDGSHREHVQQLLNAAADAHRELLAAVPATISRSLPVDAQGITRAIDHLADAAGFTLAQRRTLVRQHAVNPAVMHARVYGAAPLAPSTVIGAFVDGARVRAEALVKLADSVECGPLADAVRAVLIEHPLPSSEQDPATAVGALRDAYDAQEQAALLIAAQLDAGAIR